MGVCRVLENSQYLKLSCFKPLNGQQNFVYTLRSSHNIKNKVTNLTGFSYSFTALTCTMLKYLSYIEMLFLALLCALNNRRVQSGWRLAVFPPLRW